MRTGVNTEVRVCYIVSPGQFWCQLASSGDFLSEMLEKAIKVYEKTRPTNDLIVEKGIIYIVRYTHQMQFTFS